MTKHKDDNTCTNLEIKVTILSLNQWLYYLPSILGLISVCFREELYCGWAFCSCGNGGVAHHVSIVSLYGLFQSNLKEKLECARDTQASGIHDWTVSASCFLPGVLIEFASFTFWGDLHKVGLVLLYLVSLLAFLQFWITGACIEKRNSTIQ